LQSASIGLQSTNIHSDLDLGAGLCIDEREVSFIIGLELLSSEHLQNGYLMPGENGLLEAY
jgi:hypothetical protein